MKKIFNLLLAAVLLFSAACKDDEEPSQDLKDTEVVAKQVTESLTGKANLTTFISVFNSLELSSADIENGITIFAPLDEAMKVGAAFSGNLRTTDTAPGPLTSEVLKDHIVKGIIKTADLINGKLLTALSGKQLKVVVIGGDIWVNGVLLSGKDIASGEKHVIHTVAKLFNGATENAGVIEITVWNSSKWAPEKSKGEKEAGVVVSLYSSKQDYAQNKVAYTKTTDAEGKARFTDLEAGKQYFIEAKKDGLSNIFYKSAQTVDGVYIGRFQDGLFQNQEEVASYYPQSDGKPGNFRWKDLDSDRGISNSDMGALPSQEVETVNNQTVNVEVLIGYNDNLAMSPIRSGEAALQLLNDSYQKLNTWHKNLVMMDGILSDDAECGNMTNWCDFDNFSLNASNSSIAYVWQTGYKNIGQLNKLIRDVPNLSFAEKNEVIAQAKGLRGFIYLQLLTYFGNRIPLQTGLEFDSNVASSSEDEVYNYIKADLQVASSELPAKWATDKAYQLSGNAAKVLLAKAALWKKDYATAFEFTSEILQNGGYVLMESTSQVFANATNAEIIWDFSFSLPSSFSNYFYGRAFCPALRLSEVYLINAESQFRLGNNVDGLNRLNTIRGQVGLSPANSSDDLNAALNATWKASMSKEGVRFSNLVRWQMAMDTLAPKGYKEYNALLPVPMYFLNSYPNVMQNPGY